MATNYDIGNFANPKSKSFSNKNKQTLAKLKGNIFVYCFCFVFNVLNPNSQLFDICIDLIVWKADFQPYMRRLYSCVVFS
jgi:hypothetical protein